MCDQCIELDGKIEHYQRMASRGDASALRLTSMMFAFMTSGIRLPLSPSDQA
jgi:hypothetical protein